MPEIKLLDQNTINKIAAGEVVERPSSVVKELVENSIDAGASAITVEIKEGGISFIRITDNGIGISKKDIQTAFIRHSTSKIKSIEDLITVSSLGFRGEALASIAAVSQVEVITKTYDDITGIRYVIEGGKEVSTEEIGCPEGTTIIIKNLFYNTPARRKFLKKPATEGSYISELINKLALGNTGISFKFIYNNAIKLHTSGNNVLKDSIFSVYGKDIVKNSIPIEVKTSDFEISGFIGKPQISRANRNYENYYINGRYIKSKLLMKAIEDAYKTKLTVHKYPFTVFHMTISPDLVDVNVHPTKMEVRFNNEAVIYERLKNGIDEALRKIDLIPEVSLDRRNRLENNPQKITGIPEPFEKKRLANMQSSNTIKEKTHDYSGSTHKMNDDNPSRKNLNQPVDTFRKNSEIMNKQVLDRFDRAQEQSINKITTPDRIIDQQASSLKNDAIKKDNEISDAINGDKLDVKSSQMDAQKPEETNKSIENKGIIAKEIKGEQGELLDTKFIDKKSVKSHKIIGQLFNTYWIVELESKFYMIDQHAAHERVLYERLLDQLHNTGVMSQGLLQPIIIHVSIKEKQLIHDYGKVFSEIGFEIEEFGKDAYAIRSVPYIFAKSLNEDQFIDILDNLNEHYDDKKYDIILDNIATMACKAAVKAHDKLSVLEYEKLLDELLTLENPYTCPHGRPTIVSMTRYELEKKFKRIQ